MPPKIEQTAILLSWNTACRRGTNERHTAYESNKATNADKTLETFRLLEEISSCDPPPTPNCWWKCHRWVDKYVFFKQPTLQWGEGDHPQWKVVVYKREKPISTQKSSVATSFVRDCRCRNVPCQYQLQMIISAFRGHYINKFENFDCRFIFRGVFYYEQWEHCKI